MHPEKIKQVIALPAEERYDYLIAKAAEWEELWLIKDGESYATMGESETQPLIPVWPEEDFARLLLAGSWATYTAEAMGLHEFVEWLDELAERGYRIAAFPVPEQSTVVVDCETMKQDLDEALSDFE